MPTKLTQRAHHPKAVETRRAVQLRLRPTIYSQAKDKAKREGIPIAKVVEQSIQAYCTTN